MNPDTLKSFPISDIHVLLEFEKAMLDKHALEAITQAKLVELEQEAQHFIDDAFREGKLLRRYAVDVTHYYGEIEINLTPCPLCEVEIRYEPEEDPE